MKAELVYLDEPQLLFGHEQGLEDPRDGLTLFGPLDRGRPYGIRAGAIGTKDGIERLERWVVEIQGPVFALTNEGRHAHDDARPPFPGFEAVFGIPWSPAPHIHLEVLEDELHRAIYLDDPHQRVYGAVNVYADRMIEAKRKLEEDVDIWFVVVPDDVYRYCRPRSVVPSDLRLEADRRISRRRARELRHTYSLLPDEESAAVPYHYEVHFHNQLKARLLEHRMPTQLIRESTVAYGDFVNERGQPKRKLGRLRSSIAWNLSVAAFYKAGGRPWKLGSVREGVCYLGLTFKVDTTATDDRTACCAAQMFLDSGDGTVFKGAVGPWYSPQTGEYHLDEKGAADLIDLAVSSYTELTGRPPRELFIHGKVWFSDEEWQGFQKAVTGDTRIVGVRIRPTNHLKLYRRKDHPILRGLAFVQSPRSAFLWTRGFIPRLQTYPGLEVPNPVKVDVCRGDADIEVVLRDILALTKLNYNACIYGDGLPVTLKFADAVGEILTAGPIRDVPPLPFKHYI